MNIIDAYKKAILHNSKYIVHTNGIKLLLMNNGTRIPLHRVIVLVSNEELLTDLWEIEPNKKILIFEGVSFKTIDTRPFSLHGIDFHCATIPYIPGHMGVFPILHGVTNARVTVEYEE